MNKALPLCVAIALLLQIPAAPAQNAPAAPPKGVEAAALEQKLLGAWQGGPCVGTYTFNADGTFDLKHFTPGGNSLTGTWSVRWDALPPTLVLTHKTSDFRTKDATRAEYAHLGKPLDVKLVELDADKLVLRFPDYKSNLNYQRPEEK